jgi:hypothetical protein
MIDHGLGYNLHILYHLRSFTNCKAYFTLGVKVMFVLKSNIPIGAITEISPKGFTIGVKVEKNKIKFMVLIDPKAQNRYLST